MDRLDRLNPRSTTLDLAGAAVAAQLRQSRRVRRGGGVVRHEIALAALVRDGRILLAHRHPQRRWYPDCWDLIGGHVEPGESPEEAVRRECREEIAVNISGERRVDVGVTDPDLVLHAFLVTAWVGQPVNAAPDEHDALTWFGVDDLPGLPLADPSYATWLPLLISAAELPASR